MRRLQVVAAVPLYPPGSRVGAWLATHELLAGVAARGHSVRVVPFLARPAAPYMLDGVRVEPGARRRELCARADVVVCHAGSPRASDALAGMSLSAPVVRLVHGLPIDGERLLSSALVVANSAATARALAHGPYSGPLVVVRPPTDPLRFRVVPGDSVTLVNLSRAKGADVFWRLSRRFPDTPFLGVRGGYGEQLLERRPNVTVLGPQRDMRDVYARTRVLLMPSRAETWGMVAVEAMASGIPVLARPTAGLRESLGRAGNFPTDDSLDAWQDALARLLSQRGWAGAAARARRRSRELDPAAERRTFADALEDVAAGRAL